MLEISSISLENEMDLPLTHKKAANITRYIGLTISTQATFATAVAEVCRAVIEKTLNSVLYFNLLKEEERWFLIAKVLTDSPFNSESEELKYAKRLIPVLDVEREDGQTAISLRLGLPRSIPINKGRVKRIVESLKSSLPESPYEEIKQKNKELFTLAEEREEQLRLSNFLNEKKSEFLSIASHELKTPLTVIKAYAQIGKSFKDKDPEKMAEYLDKINHQATKVNILIQQLLDLTKIENNKVDYRLETVELNSFIKEILSSIRYSHPKHHLITNFGEPVFVSLDKLRIEQVLINLVSNAAKYSNQETNITISISDHIPGNVTIAVKDEGIGLSKENLKKVFDKFFRADEVTQRVSGLGMGLYITARIVKEHHGKIWAESSENIGSTFYFSLPVLQ